MIRTAMGPLNLMVAQDGVGGAWMVVLTITPRVPVPAGAPVANAMDVQAARDLIAAIRLGIAEVQKQAARSKPD